MDELNKAYRKLKAHYKAVNPISIDPETLLYKMDLDTKNLSPMVQNLVEKIVDLCDELEDIDSISVSQFSSFIQQYKDRYVFLNQLESLYSKMDEGSKMMVVEFIAEELSIEISCDETEKEESLKIAS